MLSPLPTLLKISMILVLFHCSFVAVLSSGCVHCSGVQFRKNMFDNIQRVWRCFDTYLGINFCNEAKKKSLTPYKRTHKKKWPETSDLARSQCEQKWKIWNQRMHCVNPIKEKYFYLKFHLVFRTEYFNTNSFSDLTNVSVHAENINSVKENVREKNRRGEREVWSGQSKQSGKKAQNLIDHLYWHEFRRKIPFIISIFTDHKMRWRMNNSRFYEHQFFVLHCWRTFSLHG